MDRQTSTAGIGSGGNWSPVSTHIVRSICNPLTEREADFDGSFTIFANGLPGRRQDDVVVLVCEIQTSNIDNTHMLAATALQMLHCFDGVPDLADETEYTDFLEQAAGWGSHILWDFTISHIRAIASGIQHPELRISSLTHKPTLLKADGMTPLFSSENENNS